MTKQLPFVGSGFKTWDDSSGAENLPPAIGKPSIAKLTVAENARFKQGGGVRVRDGHESKITLGTGLKVDSIKGFETDNWSVMLIKSGTKIFQTSDPDSGIAYDIGVTRTAGEIDHLFPKRKDIFSNNKTDNQLRIFISTVVSVDTGTGVLTFRDGDDDDFAASGTFYIRGIPVTYSGKSSNTCTGCSGLTAAMVFGDIITQSTEYASNPKVKCMGEIEGSAIEGGNPDDPTALIFSEPSTPVNPELFYSFPISYRKSLPRDITAIESGDSVTLIGMKKGLQYSSGFDLTTGVILTSNLSGVHSIPNAFCICQTKSGFVMLTAEGRILPVEQTQAGFRIVEDPKKPIYDMDYPVSKYIQANMDKSDLSMNFVHFDPATSSVSACIKLMSGITTELVYQTDIGAWSRDTGRNFSCKTVFKGRTYAGSDSSDVVYLQDEGATDDGIPVNFRIVTGVMTFDQKRTTFDVLKATIGGLLSATGEFTVRIITDGGITYTQQMTAQQLILKKLMKVTTGVSVGGGQISAEQVGSGGNAIDNFTFTDPIELSIECESVQLEVESDDEGCAIEIRDFRIDIETEGEQSFDSF